MMNTSYRYQFTLDDSRGRAALRQYRLFYKALNGSYTSAVFIILGQHCRHGFTSGKKQHVRGRDGGHLPTGGEKRSSGAIKYIGWWCQINEPYKCRIAISANHRKTIFPDLSKNRH